MATNNYGLPDELSLQSVFDKVCTHLLRQGKPSVTQDEEDACMYRDGTGCACAIGCLISDEDYNPHFERTNVGALISAMYKDIDGRFPFTRQFDGPKPFPPQFNDGPYRDLLNDLQALHDNAPLTRDGSFDRMRLFQLMKRFAYHNQLSDDEVTDRYDEIRQQLEPDRYL